YSSVRLSPSINPEALFEVASLELPCSLMDVLTFNGTALDPGFLASSIVASNSTSPSSNRLFAKSLVTQPSNPAYELPLSEVTMSNCGPLQPLRTTSQP